MLIHWQNWLASELQGHVCPYTAELGLRSGTTVLSILFFLFKACMLEIQTHVPHAGKADTLPTEPSSQPLC